MGAIDSGVVAAITAPHLLYAFIWFLPALWRQVFSKPVRAFQTSATVLKGEAPHMDLYGELPKFPQSFREEPLQCNASEHRR